MRISFVVLRFTAPFHVGRWSLLDTYDYIPSDTIYSALYSLSAATGVEAPSRVSSAYPVKPDAVTNEDMLGVPVPATWRVEAIKQGATGKKVKRARFMPLKCLKGGRVEVQESLKCRVDGDVVDLAEWPTDKLGLSTRQTRTTRGTTKLSPADKLGLRIAVPRNRISRHIENADPYRVAVFQPMVPYVVYYQGGDPKIFDILGKLGLGGDRSAGLGKFEVISRGEVEFPDGGRSAMLLGVGRPHGFSSAIGEWAVRSWRCTHGIIGPVSVLLDGGVLEGNFDFEDIERTDAPCLKRLSPLWVWLS
jgi:CRISPR-associated protein Csm4